MGFGFLSEIEGMARQGTSELPIPFCDRLSGWIRMNGSAMTIPREIGSREADFQLQ